MKCYIDSFTGPVPCIAVSQKLNETCRWIIVRITANRGPHRRGQVTAQPPWRVFPRHCLRTRSGHYRIMPYPFDIFEALPKT